MGKNSCFEHYKAFYIKDGIALYKENKFIQLFNTDEEVLGYVKYKLKNIGYFINRYIPMYEDTPIAFLLNEKPKEELQPFSEAIAYRRYPAVWNEVAYKGENKKSSLSACSSISSSYYGSTFSIEGLTNEDLYKDEEDTIASMSEEEYERYLRLKRI